MSEKLFKLLFLWKQKSKLQIEILDSRFHGNDKIKILDSRFHGNDKIELLDPRLHGNDKIKGDTGFPFIPQFREDKNKN